MARMAGTASTDPAVITRRGPMRSSQRPTGTPMPADTTSPTEKAPVAAVAGQPVSAVIAARATGKA